MTEAEVVDPSMTEHRVTTNHNCIPVSKQLVHLKWDKYGSSIMQIFDQLLEEELFVDVTLVCPGYDSCSKSLKAHKLMLSACSNLLQAVLQDNPSRHPIIILPPEVSLEDLRLLLGFIYRGEMSLPRSRLESVLKAADVLQVKGISPQNIDDRPIEEPTKLERPPSQQNHSSKRKSCPKFRFLKGKAKRLGSNDSRESGPRQNGNHSDLESSQLARVLTPEGEEDEKPMDFTIKTEDKEEEDGINYFSKSQINGAQQMTGSQVNNDFLEGLRIMPSPDLSISNGLPTMVKTSQTNPYLFSFDLTSNHASPCFASSPTPQRSYTKMDMSLALDALKNRNMTLSKASERYGIPATTLWQRANRLGISTPKRESCNKTWYEADLNDALEALRTKKMSANKAAKRYGIPSSTLYKIARKENIELAQPFNAVQTSWSQEDLDKALEAIKKGMPVQKAAAEHGIPSGTLYGRCKKVGVVLSKTTTVHWSEEDMTKALESVRTGGMSINQAAIHHNLPYSSLYGRINRLKKEQPTEWGCLPQEVETYLTQRHALSMTSPTLDQRFGQTHSATPMLFSTFAPTMEFGAAPRTTQAGIKTSSPSSSNSK